MMKWYVMNVFSGKERSVKEKIEKQLSLDGMEKYVKQILVPREKIFEIRKGKKVKMEKNFFPGYIMIECEINGELIKSIKGVNGVIAFLSDKEGVPIPMRDFEVTNLLGKIDEIEQSDTSSAKSEFIVGQHVNIIDGPFTTMNGVISKIITERGRVIVDVNIFSRKTPVDLSFEQINAI